MRSRRPAIRAALGVALIAMSSLLLPQVATAAPFAPAFASPGSGEHVGASGLSRVIAATPPATPIIVAPSDGAIVAASPVGIDGTADPGTTVRVTDATTGAVYSATTDVHGAWALMAPLANGTRELRARAFDAADNTSSSSPPTTILVDTVPPLAPTILLPAEGGTTNATSVEVSGRAEPGATLRLDEGSTLASLTVFGDGTWRTTLSFAPGVHAITARVWDAAGHPSPATVRTFTVDTVAPSAPVISTPVEDALLGPTETTIAGTGEPGSDIFVTRGTLTIGSAITASNGTWFTRVTSPSGPNEIRVRQRDRAGNFGPFSPIRRYVVDDQAPVVTITTPSEQVFLPGQEPLITGTATDNIGVDDIRLDFYDLAGRGVMSARAICTLCPAGTAVTWRSSDTPLAGRFVVKVYANDRVGNRSFERTTVITVLRTP